MEHKDGRKYCVGCVYFYGDYEVNRCCNYIFRPRGKAALPAWEGLYRKEGENEKQETGFNIIALSLYSIYNIILYLDLVCMLL